MRPEEQNQQWSQPTSHERQKTEPPPLSPKAQELFSRRETLSFTVNQWLAAQLRLFRKRLEKEQKKIDIDMIKELINQ